MEFIELLYHFIFKVNLSLLREPHFAYELRGAQSNLCSGAEDGNRTRVSALRKQCSTTELDRLATTYRGSVANMGKFSDYN